METGHALVERKVAFVLPKEDINNLKVFKYLTNTTGLPGQLVNDLINEGVIYQDIRGNCVFPCFNEIGEPSGALTRSTLPNVSCKSWHRNSDKSYGWLLKPQRQSNLILVTETPINAMSIIALNPDLPFRKKYILSLGSLENDALRRFLWNYPQVKSIVLALNNQQSYLKIAELIKKKYGKKYRIAKYLPQGHSDWNRQLLAAF